MAMRLPMRRNSWTVFPSMAVIGRVCGAQDEDTLQSHALKRLANDSRLECGEIGGDVGEFGH